MPSQMPHVLLMWNKLKKKKKKSNLMKTSYAKMLDKIGIKIPKRLRLYLVEREDKKCWGNRKCFDFSSYVFGRDDGKVEV